MVSHAPVETLAYAPGCALHLWLVTLQLGQSLSVGAGRVRPCSQNTLIPGGLSGQLEVGQWLSRYAQSQGPAAPVTSGGSLLSRVRFCSPGTLHQLALLLLST